ncbi:MAG: hypothetical protein PHY14_02055 [Candidatus Gracilibacteria bacterium]|nr:hypothetical protein [Candidatus Gracilibacteria bacterium]
MNNSSTHLYAFTLGREWKLSLAELFAVFGADAYRIHTETIAIFQIHGYSDEQLAKKFLTIGGSIRIIKILGETDTKRFPTDVIHEIQSSKGKIQNSGGKVTFALGSYGIDFPVSNIGLRIKKTLQERGFSARLVNIENKNIVSAVFKREKLGKSQTEYNLIQTPAGEEFGVTIACQDIDAYANRDTGKSRDMIVGMMPPKLVQMMINLARSVSEKSLKNEKFEARKNLGKEFTSIVNDGKDFSHNEEVRRFSEISLYDPFCGLGTTLIEAANMGITEVYGSDISAEMVRASTDSLEEFIKTEKMWQERIRAVGGTPNKDFSDFRSSIVQLDARKVKDAAEKLGTIDFHRLNLAIVSEGFLGEIMSPRDIGLEKVQAERKKLASMYSDFFRGLADANFRGSIVMSFPFWNIHGTYSYFGEIYEVIEKNGFEVVSLLPWEMKLNTSKGSLLYRRENQTVGREIVKIVKKSK